MGFGWGQGGVRVGLRRGQGAVRVGLGWGRETLNLVQLLELILELLTSRRTRSHLWGVGGEGGGG